MRPWLTPWLRISVQNVAAFQPFFVASVGIFIFQFEWYFHSSPHSTSFAFSRINVCSWVSFSCFLFFFFCATNISGWCAYFVLILYFVSPFIRGQIEFLPLPLLLCAMVWNSWHLFWWKMREKCVKKGNKIVKTKVCDDETREEEPKMRWKWRERECYKANERMRGFEMAEAVKWMLHTFSSKRMAHDMRDGENQYQFGTQKKKNNNWLNIFTTLSSTICKHFHQNTANSPFASGATVHRCFKIRQISPGWHIKYHTAKTKKKKNFLIQRYTHKFCTHSNAKWKKHRQHNCIQQNERKVCETGRRLKSCWNE